MHTLIMTGATSGIGRPAAAALLARDPSRHLALVAREETGRALVAGLGADASRVTLIPVDLASVSSVREATGALRDKLDSGQLPPARLFAGNAGLNAGDAVHATVDGYETTFAVNVLANHLLIGDLTPYLQPGGRIVITSSDTHFGTLRHGGMRPVWTDPETLARPGTFANADSLSAGGIAYATSKLSTIYLVHEWARRLPEDIDIVAYNPGFVPGTDLGRNTNAVARAAVRVITPILTTARVVDTTDAAGRKLADVIDGTVASSSGDYIDRTTIQRSSDESYHPAREESLWEFLEQIRSAATH